MASFCHVITYYLRLKTTITEFSFIEIFFTNQYNRLLEFEDSMNITLSVGIKQLCNMMNRVL